MFKIRQSGPPKGKLGAGISGFSFLRILGPKNTHEKLLGAISISDIPNYFPPVIRCLGKKVLHSFLSNKYTHFKMNGKTLLAKIAETGGKKIFEPLYGAGSAAGACRRYSRLIQGMLHWQEKPPEGGAVGGFDPSRGSAPGIKAEELRLFTAPGRTELGGNHTDHNRGKVLAASIQLDVAAVAAPRDDHTVIFRSTAYPDVVVDLRDLSPQPGEAGRTEALVRGIAAEFAAQGTPVGGFTANADSTVLPGSGLSSSAAVEALLARIFDKLYGQGTRSALEIARIGQRAENTYFGKPSGLMDQAACAFGGAVYIDFAESAAPRIQRINFDLEAAGYALCVVNTRGSHADLTEDYAAIPREMKGVAAFFGKEVLRDLDAGTVIAGTADLRKALGDRAVLRALHFFNENQRVEAMREVLEKAETAQGGAQKGLIAEYLRLAGQSGDSSWELLQNYYSPAAPEEQGISLAMALSREFLRTGPGVCRVHGGGFAGTIQVIVPQDRLGGYIEAMEGVFGPGAVTALRVRPQGAVELLFQD
jgi:galactokinase